MITPHGMFPSSVLLLRINYSTRLLKLHPHTIFIIRNWDLKYPYSFHCILFICLRLLFRISISCSSTRSLPTSLIFHPSIHSSAKVPILPQFPKPPSSTATLTELHRVKKREYQTHDFLFYGINHHHRLPCPVAQIETQFPIARLREAQFHLPSFFLISASYIPSSIVVVSPSSPFS